MAKAARSAENHGTFTMGDYFKVFTKYWLPLLNVFCVFFVTLLLFPSVLLGIQLYPLGRPYDLFIPGKRRDLTINTN